MDSVHVLSYEADVGKKCPTQSQYDRIVDDIDAMWENFFNKSIKVLISKLTVFFDEHKGSPFPVVAHVMPPQDSTDATPFIKALKELPVPFIEKRIHHIQQDRMILFNTAPPPSDVPRVMSFYSCYDSVQAFQLFIDKLFKITFSFGFTPDDSAIKTMKSEYFDHTKSFTLLLNYFKQSIFLHLMSLDKPIVSEIFDSDPNENIDQIMKSVAFSKNLTPSMIIKNRLPALNLTGALLKKFNISPFILDTVDSLSEVFSSQNVENLKKNINADNNQEIIDFCKMYLPEYASIFDVTPTSGDSSPKINKTKQSRKNALAGIKAVDNNVADKIIKLLSKVFRALPKNCPNQFKLSPSYFFNPRKDIKEGFSNADAETDTAAAFQILNEQGKIVSASNWLMGFSTKQNITDKAVAIARFQVAVSELEYLGFADKNTRVPDSFRHIIRV